MAYDLLIRGGTLIDPAAGIHEKKDLAITGQRVAAVLTPGGPATARRVIDAAGLLVAPGFIDLHVHVFSGVTHYGIDVDPAQRQRFERQWDEAGYELPLVIIPSPYRSIVDPLVRYLRERRRAANPGTLISAVIPEFIVPGRITQLLHNQTGLAIKGILAAEAGIAVTSVPFHLRTNGNDRVEGSSP